VARGWESKSVEAQQAEAAEKTSKPRRLMSPEESARWRQKETLRLARQRVLDQLASSANPRLRQLLQIELADLEQKINSLGA
jgi:hypothetical protein